MSGSTESSITSISVNIVATQAETRGAIQEVFGCSEAVTHQYFIGGGFRKNTELYEVYEGYTVQEEMTE